MRPGWLEPGSIGVSRCLRCRPHRRSKLHERGGTHVPGSRGEARQGDGAPRWAGVVAALCATVVCSFGGMGCGSTSSQPDTGPDLAAACPVDWEHTADPRMAAVTLPVYYTRPFFTTCKDGGFYHLPWMDYDPPITEFNMEEMAFWTGCLSGKCRDGACEDDVAYIESLIPPDFVMEEGRYTMSSDECYPCNQNKALYSVCSEHESISFDYICDGGLGTAMKGQCPTRVPAIWRSKSGAWW